MRVWSFPLVLLVLGSCHLERERAKKALEHPDPAVRSETLEQLAEGGKADHAALVAPLLRDPSARVRKKAVAALGALGVGPHLRQVIGRLNDSDLEVRLTAVRVLGDSGRKGARPALLLTLQDPSMVVRRAAGLALEALGMTRSEQVAALAQEELDEQIARLTRRDHQLRATSARMIGLSGQPAGLKPLLPLLSHRSPLVVRAAAWAVGRLGGADALGHLVTMAASRDVMIRRSAALGLAELKQPRARELLFKLAQDPMDVVKESALDALAKDSDAWRGRLPVLCPLLAAQQPKVARRAAILVGRGPVGSCAAEVKALCKRAEAGEDAVLDLLAPLPGPTVDAALNKLAQNSYDVFRHEAVKWIAADRWGELDESARTPQSQPSKNRKQSKLAGLLSKFPERPPEQGVDPLLPPRVPAHRVAALVKALSGRQNTDKWLTKVALEAPMTVRVVALAALARGDSGQKAVARALSVAVKSKEAPIRRAALVACHRLKEGALPTALELLQDGDFDVRSEAAHCLGRLRKPQAVKPLLVLLQREHSLAAIQALAQIGDHAATKPILALLQEDHAESRQGERVAVIDALGRLKDREAVPALEREVSHNDWQVRRAAAGALLRVSRPASIRALVLCKHDYYAEVRGICRAALRTISSSGKKSQKAGNDDGKKRSE